jgi:hypothetical protein
MYRPDDEINHDQRDQTRGSPQSLFGEGNFRFFFIYELVQRCIQIFALFDMKNDTKNIQ